MCLSLEHRQVLAEVRAALEQDEAVLRGWILDPSTAPDPEAWVLGSMTEDDHDRLRSGVDTDPLTRKQ